MLSACSAGQGDGQGVITPLNRLGDEGNAFRKSNSGFEVEVGSVHANLGPDGLFASDGNEELALRLTSWGRADNREPPKIVEPIWSDCEPGTTGPPDWDCSTRVELRRPGLTEFWRSIAGGLEQAWLVEQQPPGRELLELRLEFDHAVRWEVDEDGLGTRITGSRGGSWLYRGLAAFDANGEPLAARMEATADGVALLVEDNAAAYPVIVDPTLTKVAQVLPADGDPEDRFGISVSGAGDVNGDGFDDLIVGAIGDDDNGYDAGAAYVYLGSASGVQILTETKLLAWDGTEYDSYGRVSGAGDVNADGFDDVIVGAKSDGESGSNSGSAYVYLGSTSGIDIHKEAKLTASDAEAGDYFGESVSRAGDVNGDGYDDVMLGASGDDDGGMDAGSAYLYLGSSTGIENDSELKLIHSDAQERDYFGGSVAAAGDVNHDGFDDVIIGATGVDDHGGAAFVYLGSVTGVELESEIELNATPEFEAFGDVVAAAGDTNNDGYDDVLVGVYYASLDPPTPPVVHVYMGSSAGTDGASASVLVAPDAEPPDFFGSAASGAGDVNQDGYDDVIIGAFGDRRRGLDGSAYVYLGSPRGPDASSETKISAESKGHFGWAVAAAGDVDDDGYDDVIVGSPAGLPTTFAGTAFVFAGTGDTGDEGDLFQQDTGTLVGGGDDDGCRCSAAPSGRSALALWIACCVVAVRRRRSR